MEYWREFDRPSFAVALDGVFDEVKAGKRNEGTANDGEQRTDPCRIVNAARIVQSQHDAANGGEIAEIKRQSQCEKKAVAADALEEIRPSGSKHGAMNVHEATPTGAVRLLAMEAR